MKRTLFFMCLILCLPVLIQTEVYAQPPQGRPRGGAGREGMPPPQGAMNSSEDRFTIEHFPDIPSLSPDQRIYIGNILMNEQKEITKLIEKKSQYIHRNQSPKEKAKIDKIDIKIRKVMDKSNRKIEKKLSREQYMRFMERRSEFRFRREAPMFRGRPEGERPPEGMSPRGNGRQGGPPGRRY